MNTFVMAYTYHVLLSVYCVI